MVKFGSNGDTKVVLGCIKDDKENMDEKNIHTPDHTFLDDLKVKLPIRGQYEIYLSKELPIDSNGNTSDDVIDLTKHIEKTNGGNYLNKSLIQSSLRNGCFDEINDNDEKFRVDDDDDENSTKSVFDDTNRIDEIPEN